MKKQAALLKVAGIIGLCLAIELPPTPAGELTPAGAPIFDVHIDDAWGVTVSPDGHHVYVTSNWRAGALVAFQKNPETGELEHIQTLMDGRDGADGLAGPRETVISSDGLFLYVAGYADDAVSVFARDPQTGILTFVEVEKGGIIWTGLDGCHDLALSPDGANLYALGHRDDTLVVFAVDRSSGELTLVDVRRGGYQGLVEFDAPHMVTVTPDGSQVFVSTTGSDTLSVFDRNPNDGTLVLARTWSNERDGLSLLVDPSEIVFSADGLNAYVACSGGRGGFIVFSYHPQAKQWSVLEEHFAGVAPDYDLHGARNLALSPDQTRLYVSAWHSDAITVYRRDVLTGMVSRAARVLRWRDIQNFSDPRQIAISPDGAYAYVAMHEDALHCFRLRSELGEISHHSVVFAGDPRRHGLNVPCRLCVSSDGLNVYCPSRDNGGIITSFYRDPGTGDLSPIQMIGYCGDYNSNHGLSNIEQVIVASNSRDVYSNSLGHDAIAHFYRDVMDGRLVFQAAYFNNSDIIEMDNPDAITLSPDERHLYAVGYNSDSIVSFEVQEDGSLLFLESQVNGFSDFDRLDGPTNLCLSPDGKHVYVAAYEDDAIVVFERNQATGLLTYQGFVSDDLNGVTGLDRVRCIITSSDGLHVYAGSANESAIACFERAPESGMLSFIEAKPTPWRAGRGMAFNSDGTRLYVPFEGADTVVSFYRNPRTGQLTEASSAHSNPPIGLDGMNGPYSVAISPDDQHLYVSCVHDDCIRTFSLNPDTQ